MISISKMSFSKVRLSPTMLSITLLILSIQACAASSEDNSTLMVGLTFIKGAADKGAVCLDGSTPVYHFHPGHGSGANSWIVDLEGGGWCNDMSSCMARRDTILGSSKHMESNAFTGILSNKSEENPDFFNWNRARLRYCDGASFAGDSENKASGLKFRGQRIYKAAVDDLMAKGMKNADQALLSGCSAGAIAVILHCDDFKSRFPTSTRVKCLSDAGLFMDAIDISGKRNMRSRVEGVVSLQGVEKMLPRTCTSHHDPTFCFFPENLINYVKAPLFLLNPSYDAIQVQASIAPNVTDPKGEWNKCKLNFADCSTSQIQFLQKFRNSMVQAVKGFGSVKHNGMFINSCFAHCQAGDQDTFLSDNAPTIDNKGISRVIGDWYFDRSDDVKKIGCPYPCEKTCHNLELTQYPYTTQFRYGYQPWVWL